MLRKIVRPETKTFGGKIEKLCTAFPLTNFIRKNFRELPFRNFSSQKFLKGNSSQKMRTKTNAPPRTGKAILIFQLKNSVSKYFLPNSFQISFFNELRDDLFWAR